MSASPIEIVGEWLQNLLDPEVVNKVVAPDAFIWNLSEMLRYWQNENFEVTTMFGESPFSIHVKVVDGKVTYLQFMEDTYATAARFRSAGSWAVHADPTGTPIEV